MFGRVLAPYAVAFIIAISGEKLLDHCDSSTGKLAQVRPDELRRTDRLLISEPTGVRVPKQLSGPAWYPWRYPGQKPDRQLSL